jgi:hypothetical protein
LGLERHTGSVGEIEPEVRNRGVFAPANVQIRFIAIDAYHESVRPDRLCNSRGDRAGSAADIENGKAGPQ